MPICIECRYPVSQLYHVLHSGNHSKSAAPTSKPSNPNLETASISQKSHPNARKAQHWKNKRPSGGADVRLTQCPRCKRFADKYVEHDFVVLFIDLVLVKPQVYRHLLFNRLSRDDDELDPSIIRLGILLLLFDVYLTWSHIESLPQSYTSGSSIPDLPILLQYGFYLFLCSITTLSQHLTIRSLARLWKFDGPEDGHDSSQGSPEGNNSNSNVAPFPTPPKKSTANSISTALFVSSCMSLFPILMVVWKYDDTPQSADPNPYSPPNSSSISLSSDFLSGQGRGADWVRQGVSWAVAVQNIEALRILLECGYFSAGGLVAAGGAVRWFVRSGILAAVRLKDGG